MALALPFRASHSRLFWAAFAGIFAPPSAVFIVTDGRPAGTRDVYGKPLIGFRRVPKPDDDPVRVHIPVRLIGNGHRFLLVVRFLHILPLVLPADVETVKDIHDRLFPLRLLEGERRRDLRRQRLAVLAKNLNPDFNPVVFAFGILLGEFFGIEGLPRVEKALFLLLGRTRRPLRRIAGGINRPVLFGFIGNLCGGLRNFAIDLLIYRIGRCAHLAGTGRLAGYADLDAPLPVEGNDDGTLPEKSKRGGVARELDHSARSLLHLYGTAPGSYAHDRAGEHYRNDANDYQNLNERKTGAPHGVNTR